MFRFPKKQRICSHEVIEGLFATGKSISESPIRIIWNFEENNDNILLRVVIIVSKKRVKLAVDRNVIKRRIREAYRIQKRPLELALERNNQQLNLAIIYQEKEIKDYKLLEQKIKLILTRLITNI